MKSGSAGYGRWSGATKRPGGEVEILHSADDKIDHAQKMRRIQNGSSGEASRSKTPTMMIRSKTPVRNRTDLAFQAVDLQKNRSTQQALLVDASSKISSSRSKSAPRIRKGGNLAGTSALESKPSAPEKHQLSISRPSKLQSVQDENDVNCTVKSVSQNATPAVVSRKKLEHPEKTKGNISICSGYSENVDHVSNARTPSEFEGHSSKTNTEILDEAESEYYKKTSAPCLESDGRLDMSFFYRMDRMSPPRPLISK